ncbi:MAG: TIGR03943 family putative permease subunit [Bacillota bacterium]
MSKLERALSEEVPLRLVILAGWSYWLYQLAACGNLRYYVHPRFGTPVLLAALCLALLALHQLATLMGFRWQGWQLMPRAKVISYIIVILPLCCGLLLPATSLDGRLAEQRGNLTSHLHAEDDERAVGELEALLVSSSEQERISAQQFRHLATLLWSRPQGVIGRSVQLTGFVYYNEGLLPGQFMLGRYQISCCTADAVVVSCLCHCPAGDKPPASGWVTVSGTLGMGEYQAQPVGVIAVSDLLAVDEPQDPYIYVGG